MRCSASQYDKTVAVKDIIDGDTLLLEDGRFVRLIGINSPELNLKNPPPEPLANESRQALKSLFGKARTLHLIFDKEKRDRYQRLLAHAFLMDGTNIQAHLLAQGTGAHVFFPPNQQYYDCYKSAQGIAQKNKAGIWQHPRYQTFPADTLTMRHIGFYRVSGRIKDVKSRKGTIWLVANDRFSFRIDAKNMKYFKKMKPELLLTHRIEASGWIFPHKSGLNMRINHPKSIEVLD